MAMVQFKTINILMQIKTLETTFVRITEHEVNKNACWFVFLSHMLVRDLRMNNEKALILKGLKKLLKLSISLTKNNSSL